MRAAHYSILIVFLLTSTSVARAADLQWHYDLDSAKRAASSSNRPILVHFWSPTCAPCQRLDQEVYTQPEVKRAMESMFVLVRLNVEEYSATASNYGVQSWPADVILAPNGQFVALLKCPPVPTQYVAQLEQVTRRAAQPAIAPTVSNDFQLAARPSVQSSAATSGQVVQTSGENRLSPQGQSNNAGAYSWGDSNSRVANYDFRNVNLGAGQAGPSRGAFAAEMPQGQLGPATSMTQAPSSTAISSANSIPTDQLSAGMTRQPAVTGYAPPNIGAPPAATAASGAFGPTPQQPSTGSFYQGPNQQQFAQQNAAPSIQPSATSPQFEMVPATQAPPVALDGYCPVQLARPADKRQAKWVKGDPRYGVVHRGRTYLFAGPAEQQEFLKDPDRYSPVMSGNDPVLLFDAGQQVVGSRRLGVFFGDRVYLFANEQTLAKFTADKKRYAEAVYVAENPGRGTLR
jgi:thiol-disulfide isomerase/thioredoxin/YHS domain-containing protein